LARGQEQTLCYCEYASKAILDFWEPYKCRVDHGKKHCYLERDNFGKSIVIERTFYTITYAVKEEEFDWHDWGNSTVAW